MDVLTPGHLLRSLPELLYVWSVFVLSWGLLTGTILYRMGKRVGSLNTNMSQSPDRYALWLIAAVNIFLVGYLIKYAPTTDGTSWMVVVNVFYTSHLLHLSVDAAKCWHSIKRCYIPPRGNIYKL